MKISTYLLLCDISASPLLIAGIAPGLANGATFITGQELELAMNLREDTMLYRRLNTVSRRETWTPTQRS